MLTTRIFSIAKEVGEAVDIFPGGMCVCSHVLVWKRHHCPSQAGTRKQQNSFTQIFILLSCLACFHVHVILKCRNKMGQAQPNRLRNSLPPDVTYHFKFSS